MSTCEKTFDESSDGCWADENDEIPPPRMPLLPIVAVAAEDCLYLVDPKLRGTSEIRRELEEKRRGLLKVDEVSEEDEVLQLLTLREFKKVEEEKKKERKNDEEKDPRRKFEEKVELKKSEAADEEQNIFCS